MLLFIEMLPTLSPSHLLWAAASLNISTQILACSKKKGIVYLCPGTANLVR